ncbi:hypothetical protein [Nostoc sp. LPT]|uniref:hypothetical protein n=1 Tax=Nostoc sp. LPT TaxID=2815387 RepID=UPI001DD87B2E|nr:hypothetical protein [Nostoc sp. LPT]MBN4001946.1 hypothetical protein [Nostoc sp. LPT]
MTVLPNDNRLRFASHQPVPQFLEAMPTAVNYASNQIGDFLSQQGTLGADELNIMAFNQIRANTLVS